MTQVLPQVPCCVLCSIIEDPLPEEVQLHPSISTPLDQLQAVDVAFNRPGRPGEREGSFDGRIVSLEHVHEVLELYARAGTTSQQPRVQRVGVTLADHRCPLLRECLYLHQLWVLLKACPERLLVRCALVLRLQEEPGELAGRWEGERSRLPRAHPVRAMGVDPLGNQRPRARKALLADLAP